MNVYWHSTAPWSPSSYSVLTARTVPDLVKAGHQVTVGTWYGLHGQPMPWSIDNGNGKTQQVMILPHHAVGGNTYGEAVLVENYKYAKADVCMTVCDVFVYPQQVTAQVNFAPWLPIDVDPAPQGIIDALGPAIYPMVYSQWGVDVLEAAGVKAHYVPCSAPADVFKPGDRDEARKKFDLGREYDFLVTMVAANKDTSDRKGLAVALQGFARFLHSHPDSVLYLHTDWGGPIKPANIAKSLGIEHAVTQPDQYSYVMGMLGETYMRDVYRASDVLLNPAKSEGFGLPLIEAQMCGCPVIATDFSTTDELLSAGWTVGGHRSWYMGADAWRMEVDPDQIADALEEAYKEKDNEALRKKARRGVVKYDGPAVFAKYWQPALRDIKKLVERAVIAV